MRFRRKSIRIDQTKLDSVMALLGARSASEAVDYPLAELLHRHELVDGIRAGTGEIENFFDTNLDR